MDMLCLTELSITERTPVRERVSTVGQIMNLRRGFMQNTKDTTNILWESEFNDEPVYYCPHCLSLKIKVLDQFVDYCDDCGCTDVETTDIFTWRSMYKKRFGKEF